MAASADKNYKGVWDSRLGFGKKSALRPLPTNQRLHRFQASVQPYIKNADSTDLLAFKKAQNVAYLTAEYRFASKSRSLFKAYCLMPENRSVLYWMSLQFSKELIDKYTNFMCQKFSD